jgi:signal transduction histidine kinase
MHQELAANIAADIASIQAIEAVPTILATVAAITGLRFVCVARVTGNSWTTCAVLDRLDFGLKIGDGLDVTTTLCEEVRDTGAAVVIDNVSADDRYRDHHTPRIYGFQSYISVPLFRPGGEYFGTLCGLDPVAAKLSVPAVTDSLALFAQLISRQLETERILADAQHALFNEIEAAELREQFIAVLGHDLRTPLSSIVTGAEVLRIQELPPNAVRVVDRISRSALRISGLVDDVVDFTRGRMGGGIALALKPESALQSAFEQVVAELRGDYPQREIVAELAIDGPVLCDAGRLAQLLSNLVKNALVHGDATRPVRVLAQRRDGKLELVVSNEGPAMTPATMAQLFKPFWRGAAEAGQGLGLGLFIVSEIAQSHGGTIDVASTDALTSFTFTLK